MDTYHGHVRTPADAIKLFEACRLGILPRVQRRLSEKERQSIKSGSVFVWDEREAGMRRWTDGKSWSASRVSGSFLTYREMEGKRGGGQFVPPPARRAAGKTPESSRGSDEDREMDGDSPDGYRYKPDGLMKQSFSITTSQGQHLHLISYYSRPHPNAPELPQPTTDPQLRNIIPQKGMYPESTIHEAQGPAVTRTPMQQAPYAPPPHQSQMQSGPVRGYAFPASPNYAWSPPPVSTPSFPHPGHQYPQQIYQTPGSSQGSPHQVHYSPHHQNQQSPTTLPPPQGQPATYSTLPPPSTGITASSQGHISSPKMHQSPGLAHARLIAEQAQIAQRALQAGPLAESRMSIQHSPQIRGAELNMSTQSLNQNSQNSISSSNSGLPTTPRDQFTAKAMENTSSQAQTIPSISSLVHAADSDLKSTSSNSRHGSRSPREGVSDEQSSIPKDIPHEKLNIQGEDQRAIRVLDRKFVF